MKAHSELPVLMERERYKDGGLWSEENIVFPDVGSGADWRDAHVLEFGKACGRRAGAEKLAL